MSAPLISPAVLRVLLNLWMASDPSPLTEDENQVLDGWLAEQSAGYGHPSVVDAFHRFRPETPAEPVPIIQLESFDSTLPPFTLPAGITLRCIRCKRTPAEIDEYVGPAAEQGITPEQMVWEEEGTLNKESGNFLCTKDYVAAGMPSTPGGWRAP